MTNHLLVQLKEFFTLQQWDPVVVRDAADGIGVLQTGDDNYLHNCFIVVEDPFATANDLTRIVAGIAMYDAIRSVVIVADTMSDAGQKEIRSLAGSLFHQLTSFTRFLDSHLRPDRVCRALITGGVDAPNSAEGLLYDKDFIEPWAVSQNGGRVAAMHHLVGGWAGGSSRRLCMVLAPAGFGKSKVTHILAKRLAAIYDEGVGDNPALPYLIPFGQYRRTTSFNALIMATQARYGPPLLTPEAFQFLVARGRALFILDGYDEMLEAQPEVARSNAAEFLSNAGPRSRILLTSRTLFYRSSTDVVGMVGDPNVTEEDIELLELEPFDRVQAKQFVRIKLDAIGDRARRVERAQEMLERDGAGTGLYGSPFFLSEFVTLVRTDRWSLTNLEKLGSLEFLVRIAFKRERERQDHTFSNVEQRAFLEAIGFDMLRTNAPAYNRDDLEVFAYEATDSMPTLEDEGQRSLSRLITHHFLSFDDSHRENGVATIKHQVWRDFFQGSALGRGLREGRTESVIVVNLKDLPEGVVRSAAGVLGEDRFDAIERMSSRANDVGLRNLLRLAAGQGVRPPEPLLQRLAGRSLVGLTLSDVDLRDCNLESTNLVEAFLVRCDLRGANLTGALLSNTSFIECKIDASISAARNASVSIDGVEYFGPQIRSPETPFEETRPQTGPVESMDQYVRDVMAARLGRFVKPLGFDQSISWQNFMGGISPRDRDFVVRRLVRALKAEGVISEDRGVSGSRPPFILSPDSDVRREVTGLIAGDEELGPTLQRVADRASRRLVA